jgi:hypothetical protein
MLHSSDNARGAFNGVARHLRRAGYSVLALGARFTFHSLREVTERKDERTVARDVAGGADSAHVLDLQLAGTYAPRGILFVADATERQNADNLADGARASEVWEAPRAGHGYELLAVAEVAERLDDWLAARLRAPMAGPQSIEPRDRGHRRSEWDPALEPRRTP